MSIEGLSIKELKQILKDANMECPSGIEKPELIELAKRAASQPKQAKKVTYFNRVKEFGVKVEECEAIFIFFHGYGADEHQFDFFQSFGITRKIAFICPKSNDEGWWPLNVAEWAMAMQTGGLLDKMKETPRGLVAARDTSLAFIQHLKARAPKSARLLLGGFSQGGVMALDVALSLTLEEPIYVGIFSSFLVDMDYWTERAKVNGKNIKALVTHGRADPLIPYAASELIVNLLKTAGSDVTFESHLGGHTLGDTKILESCKRFFERVFE